MPFINEMAGCRDAQSYQYQRSDPCQFRTRCRCSDLEITELILHRYNALRGVAGGQRATEISTLIIYVRVSTVSARVLHLHRFREREKGTVVLALPLRGYA